MYWAETSPGGVCGMPVGVNGGEYSGLIGPRSLGGVIGSQGVVGACMNLGLAASGVIGMVGVVGGV